MANLISHATGNFTAAGTWLVADTTSASIAGVTATTVGNVAGTVTDSATFTPGVITVQGILIQLSRRIGTTGTLKVILRNSTGSVDVGTVTVNCSDLPAETAVSTNASAAADGSWHFFDFVTPVVTLGATNYLVRVVTSSASQVALLGGAANDWNRLLVTTTTGAPAAADRTWVGQAYTGAGAATTYTVTQDNNNTNAYGEMNVSNGGTLAVSVAAATQYRLAGNLKCWGGSTFTYGTSGSPCVLGQATILEFNCASDGQYGFERFWNASVTFYGAAKTAVINQLAADAAASATSLTLTTTVGATWKSGDVIVLAGTTTTASQTENKALGADASGTTVGTIAALTNAHSGTAPTAGHVGNISRDLKFRSTSATGVSNGTYFFTSANYTGTSVIYYCEFAYMGSGVANKLGFYNAAIAGTEDVEFCSFHDLNEASAIMVNYVGNGSFPYTFSNNILYNTRSGFINVITTATPTISGNFVAAATPQSSGMVFGDVGGTITNNIVVGTTNAGSYGMTFNEAAGNVGTISGNIAYNNFAIGIGFTASMLGTISSFTSWRNGTYGFALGQSYAIPSGGATAGARSLTLDQFTAFGNAAGNAQSSGASNGLIISNWTLNAGVTNTAPFGLDFVNGAYPIGARMVNCTFGATTAHVTADFRFGITSGCQMYAENCSFSAATLFATSTNCAINTFFQSDKHQQTAGNWFKFTPYGTLAQDTVIFDTGTQSVKMTPSSANQKLVSDPFYVPVASGKTITVSVRVRKGTSYNGNNQRLMLRANSAMGITTDTVIATAAASIGTWETLSGTTAAASQNGTYEFFVDNDGTAGTTNYQNMTATSS